MLPDKIAFVDIETTGMRSFYDRIIEIAILRVEENQIVRTFHSLINPEGHLPPEITLLTGITAGDLENAPTFRQIKDDILETLSGCVFVAHNVRFDYGFLKNEFQRLDLSFSPRHFCTVRLSRALYPRFRRHNLDSLIERFGFESKARHRALSDAKILFLFYNKIMQDFPLSKIEKAVRKALKKPSIPVRLQTNLETIPENPGVYVFYSENNMPLYIGKSKNLKERILSHFSADLRSPIEMKISQQIVSIETVSTAGELGALFLESQMIKKMLPLYNKKSRLKKELVTLKKVTNDQGYDTIKIEPTNQFNNLTIQQFNNEYFSSILGVFKSKKQARDFLVKITKDHNLCEKLMGLEKTKSACFAYRLGQCNGACTGIEKPIKYNMKFAAAFALSKIKPWPFPGTIIIKETNLDKKEYFLINNWCYLGGSIKIDPSPPAFDLDFYNILKQFLSNPQNYKKISTLETDSTILSENL